MVDCFRCGKSSNEAKILQAIDKDEIVNVCEACASYEDLPILRKPNTFQLKESEKPYSVYQRLSRMAGLQDREESKPEHISISGEKITGGEVERVTLDSLRERMKERYGVKKDEPKGEIFKEQDYSDLIDNYHWEIQRARRFKKLSLKQVADAIDEAETTLRMAEAGQLPDNYPVLINKLEAYLSVRLRKKSSEESLVKKYDIKEPAKVFNFDKGAMDGLTISDLREMAKARKEAEQSSEKPKPEEGIAWRSTRVIDEEGREEKLIERKEDKKEEGIVGSEVEFMDDEEIKEDL